LVNDALRIGDRLQVMTPESRFVAETGRAARLLLLAAGSGITPMMSIAQSALAAHPEAEVTLVYGNRTTESVMYRAALDQLKDRYLGRFTLIHILSREEQDIPLLNGRVDADKVTALTHAGAIDPVQADGVFLCGPGAMIDDVTKGLASLGVASDRLHFERFTPAEGSAPRRPASQGQNRRGQRRVRCGYSGRCAQILPTGKRRGKRSGRRPQGRFGIAVFLSGRHVLHLPLQSCQRHIRDGGQLFAGEMGNRRGLYTGLPDPRDIGFAGSGFRRHLRRGIL